MAYMRLGDLLIAAGAITEEQLQTALQTQKQSGQRLGDVLIDSGIITQRQLIDALQMQLGVDYIDLTRVSIPVELAKYVPRAIARKYCVVPVKLVKDELYVAMSDPLDFVAQEELKSASRRQIVPMIATRRAVEQAIATLYGNEGTARVIEEMKRAAGDNGRDIVPAQMTGGREDADAAPTIRFVNSLIERAFNERASDIHLEPQDGEMVVRMRIDGLLHKMLTVPANLQNTVISRLKVMGGMNISERKIPQDGRAMVHIHQHELDLRISSMPTIYGEKVVLRLLDKSRRDISKEAIGLTGDDLRKYEALLQNSSGVILIVGPTGSGKSTTMCAMLQELCSEETNIMTLEDPVEYDIPGVSQCQINEKTGMTFAAGLRGVISQRLVRRICPHCKKPYRPADEELSLLKLPADADITFYRGEGCPECRHTGFHGRRAVFEILTVNDKLRRLISQGADYDALLKAAADTDFTSMRDNCRALVLSGETTAAEAARAIHSTID